MAIVCPHTGSVEWKQLVESLRAEHGKEAEAKAHLAFHRAGDEIPSPDRARQLIAKNRPMMEKGGQVVREFFKETWDGLQKAFYPEARSPLAKYTATTLREQLGKHGVESERTMRTMDRDIREMHKGDTLWARAMDRFAGVGKTAADVYLRGQSDSSNRNFMQWMDTGDKPEGWKPSPEHEAIAKVIRDVDEKKVKEVQDLGTGVLENARENYFPHMWTPESRKAFSQAIGEAFEQGIGDNERDLNNWTPDARGWVKERVRQIREEGASKGNVEDQTALFTSKRPWLKKPASLKQRVFEDFNTGMDFGLEPVTHNPLDAKAVQWSAMDAYINSHRVKDALVGVGGAKFVRLGGLKPAGMVPMTNGEVFAPPAPGGDMGEGHGIGPQLTGHWYVYKTAGQVIENYLSRGLQQNPGFRAWMSAAGTLNQFQLGVVSAFHGGFTTMESMISKGALGFKEASKGNWSEAGKHFAGMPMETINNWKRGDAVIKALAGDKTAPAWASKVVQWMEMAGATTAQDRKLFTNQTDAFFTAARDKNVVGAAVRAPFAFVEQSARPIMEWLVPRQKVGVFSEMMNEWTKNNPSASHEDTVRYAQQAWNRVDSRLGQVVYNRLFVDNVAKNLTQAMVRAPGWTGGTILEVGGGFKDLAKYMNDFSKDPKTAELTDRAAYTVSLIATTAIANGILTALFTGEQPDEHDLLAFRTGEKDEHGNPIRFMLPTYMKDLYAFSHEPVKTLTNKTHPMVSLIADLERNRDYYGTEIRHAGDPMMDQIFDMGKYTVKAFQPFWTRGVQKVQERQGTATEMALPMIGVMPAPAMMTATPAQRLANEMRGQNSQTQEQFARKEIKKRVTSAAYREGPQAVNQAVASGEIGPDTGKDILKNLKTPAILKATSGLDLPRVLEVYDKANDEEKRVLLNKIRSSWRLYPERHSIQKIKDMREALKKRGLSN